MPGYFDTELGRVQISPSIVRNIILQEIQNSKSFLPHGTGLNEEVSQKTAERCIRVTFHEGTAELTLILSVRYGARIIKEARELQGNISRTLQLKAGIQSEKISINVESVYEKQESEAARQLLIDSVVEEPKDTRSLEFG